MLKTSTLMLAALGLLLGATTSHAVTVTDCSAAPVMVVNKKTIINLPGDDVIIQCALSGDEVQVTAQSIVVDGPNNGSVMSSKKGGQATLLSATQDIVIDAAMVVAADSNANTVIEAGGNISITPGSKVTAGDDVRITCTGALCTIDIAGSQIAANKIGIEGNGDVTISPASILQTDCPRDEIKIVSNNGDVIVGGGVIGGLATICCLSVQAVCSANPNDPACPFAPGGSGPIVLNDLQELSLFCQDCVQAPNLLKTCVEGDVIILAPQGNIDVSNATIMVGEGVILSALLDVNMANANISNCGPKKGVIVVTSSTCNIDGATILDDDPDTGPTLNCTQSGTPTLLGTCSSS
jgi:hypothetical protein